MKKLFGKVNGKEIYLYRLENEYLRVDILNYGGRVQSLIDKNSKIDVVLGYNTIEEYQNDDAYLGAIIGRVANCLENGKFTLNGREYLINKNDGENSQHGGIEGFDCKVWTEEEYENNSVVLSYLSQDGEEGYPGNLQVYAKYELKKNSFLVKFWAETDQTTPVNMTSHMYFNLNGEDKEFDSHQIKIKANKITPVDEKLIPHNEFCSVEKADVDFRRLRVIDTPCDLNFVLRKKKNAVLLIGESGLKLKISTNQKGMQVYTANELTERYGKNGYYKSRCAVCLEPQGFPNALNCDKYPSILIKKGKRYKFTAKYSFFS